MRSGSRLVVLIALMGAWLIPRTSQAQGLLKPSAFIDVPFWPDWDDARTAGVPGATWGSGFAIGRDSGRSGIELDIGVPAWHVEERTDRYKFAGTSYGYLQTNHSYESSSTTRRRSIDVTLLHRTRVPVNRYVTVTGLVGGAFVYRPEENSVTTKEVLSDGRLQQVNAFSRTDTRNYPAAVGRLDVEIQLAGHLSVVPRLRAALFPSLLDDGGLAPQMLVVRPEIGVRWRF